MGESELILLTSLGTNTKDAFYSVPRPDGTEEVVSAKLSPLALLLGLPGDALPDRVIALGTQKAMEDSGSTLKEGTQVPVELVCIPDGKTEDDLWEILSIMLQQVPRGSRVILELTHGFRSIPFIFFTGAFFLSSLYDVKVEHVFYGMFEAKENDVAPMVDLHIVITMMEWFYASRIFRDTGSARYIVDLLKEGDGFNEKDAYALEAFSEFYEAGLPIELGEAVRDFKRTIDGLNLIDEGFPIGRYIKEVLEEAVSPFEFREQFKRKGKIKRNIPLSGSEIGRQVAMVQLYMERKQFNQAFSLMRELLVTIFLFHNPEFYSEDVWSTRKGRRKAEEYLGFLKDKDRSSGAGLLWDKVTRWRNTVNHSGFSGEDLVSIDWDSAILLWEEVKASVDREDIWKVLKDESSCLSLPCLITPLGLSPGLLYTAVKQVKPGMLIVVTSAKARDKLYEALEEAEYSYPYHVVLIEDVHLGFDEAQPIADHIESLLDGIQDVVVNITGGTTALQYVLQHTSDRLKANHRVTQVAMVDRRSPEEIKKEPYVLGELVTLKTL